MEETEWDIQEVKRWKKTQLIQTNIGMLLIFLLLIYFIEYGHPYFFIGGFYVFVLIIAAIELYKLGTGRFIGTKTSRRVQAFDKARSGEKRWKRRKILEAVFLIALIVFITVFMYTTDIDHSRVDFSSIAFPFIGAWIGHNLGELIRMSKLEQ